MQAVLLLEEEKMRAMMPGHHGCPCLFINLLPLQSFLSGSFLPGKHQYLVSLGADLLIQLFFTNDVEHFQGSWLAGLFCDFSVWDGAISGSRLHHK